MLAADFFHVDCAVTLQLFVPLASLAILAHFTLAGQCANGFTRTAPREALACGRRWSAAVLPGGV
jgi:hypothetical protein